MAQQLEWPKAAAAPKTSFKDKMDQLRQLAILQAECTQKASVYKCRGEIDLAARFHRAAVAGANARMLIHAALMAETELSL